MKTTIIAKNDPKLVLLLVIANMALAIVALTSLLSYPVKMKSVPEQVEVWSFGIKVNGHSYHLFNAKAEHDVNCDECKKEK